MRSFKRADADYDRVLITKIETRSTDQHKDMYKSITAVNF